jgi:hypothetical protein
MARYWAAICSAPCSICCRRSGLPSGRWMSTKRRFWSTSVWSCCGRNVSHEATRLETVDACDPRWMSKSPASNQPPTASPGIRSPALYGVLVVASVRYPSKCCSFNGACTASSRCAAPCQTRYPSFTSMWSIWTGKNTPSVGCQIRSYTLAATGNAPVFCVPYRMK